MVHQAVVSSVLLLSVAAVVMISSIVSAYPAQANTNTFYGCTQPSDCQPDECCVLGMQRYSVPSCLALGKEGQYCRDQGSPRNMSVYYPNGVNLNMVNAYTLFCPCDTHYGLTCTQGTCQQSTDHKITNTV